MRFYSEVIFPRLCDFALGSPAVSRRRRALLAQANDDILEIAFGPGLNLPQCPASVRKITTVEPNAGMHRLARKRIRQTGIAVDEHPARGECLPFADHTFDCVVSTFTLCS